MCFPRPITDEDVKGEMDKQFDQYEDSFGLICHRTFDDADDFIGLDGGDAPQRTFMRLIFGFFIACYRTIDDGEYPGAAALAHGMAKTRCEQFCAILRIPWNPVRCPGFAKWWSLDERFSRDQLLPVIIACSFHRASKNINEIFIEMIKRAGFCWNWKGNTEIERIKFPDVLGPISWSIFFRHYGDQWLWLEFCLFIPLTILDFWLILQVIFRCIVARIDRDSCGDDLNLSLILLHSKYHCPTVPSLIARKIYRNLRPMSGDLEFRLNNKDCIGPVSAFKWYFRDKSAPPLDVPAAEVLAKEL